MYTHESLRARELLPLNSDCHSTVKGAKVIALKLFSPLKLVVISSVLVVMNSRDLKRNRK